jgi:hypothetical protein
MVATPPELNLNSSSTGGVAHADKAIVKAIIDTYFIV